MADGSTKAIRDVAIGDSVEAADPNSGHDQGGRPVTALHSHHDDDLIDITVTDRDGNLHVIHTTSKHPFWEDTSRTWVPAGDLRVGQELRTVDRRDILIVNVSDRPGGSEMLNLTVSGLHTFYVKAGDAAVLVHNTCGGGPGPGGQRPSPHPGADTTPHPTPGLRSHATEAADDAFRSVDDVMGGLSPGRQPHVRTVSSPAELQTVYDDLATGGVPTEWSGYKGTVVRRPDGVEVGIRGTSTSGNATIDIRLPDGTTQKVHIAG